MNRGVMPSDDRITVGGFLKDWLDAKKAAVRPKTYRSYADTVRLHIAPRIGRTVLTKLGPRDVQRMLASMERDGVKPPSVRYARTVLRIALNETMRWELVARNAATLTTPPKYERPEIVPMTLDQAHTLMNAVADEITEDIIAFDITTGLRQGEILGLIWDDVDLDAGKVWVRYQLQRVDGRLTRVPVKTAKSRREIDLPVAAIEALKRQRQRQRIARAAAGPRWKATGFVFTSTIGTPLDARNVIRMYHDAFKLAGLTRMKFHILRHSAASILAAMGASQRQVMELLGHSQLGTTMNLYTHLFPEVRRETADLMDKAFSRTG